MNDLLGLGRGAEKLLDMLGKAVGTIYKPLGIRREADAEAYRIKAIERAKAEAKQEAKLIAKQGDSPLPIIDGSNSTLHERYVARGLRNDIRKQANLERVIRHALDHVSEEVSPEPVDPDWLQTLITCAEQANSEKMQELWGKVLAGETQLPGSYSLKSLEVLRSMTQAEATAFQHACALASSYKGYDLHWIVECCQLHSRILAPLGIKLRSDSVDKEKHGLIYTEELLLKGIGLIHPEGLINGPYKRGVKLQLINNGVPIDLICRHSRISLKVLFFTPIGNELSKLLQNAPNSEHLEQLKHVLKFGFKIM